jgi:type IX secretion system PorP/SprF family membrane protein
MNKLYFHIGFLLISCAGLSQQSITNNQYYLFDYYYNPALSGGESFNPFYINYINQWAGFEDSPEKITVGFEFSPFSSNGFSLLYTNNNQGGSYSQNQLNFNYSKQIIFNDENKLSIGVGVLASQNISDYSGISTRDPNDNSFSSGQSETTLDGSFGLNYRHKKFQIGLSTLNINNSKLELNSNQLLNTFRENRQYYLTSSYSVNINEKTSFSPNLLFNFLSKDFFFTSFSLLANFDKTFSVGITNRYYSSSWESKSREPDYSNVTIALALGCEFKKFSTFYNYEISKNISFPSHELTVGYKFDRPTKKVKSKIKKRKNKKPEFFKKNFIWHLFKNNAPKRKVSKELAQKNIEKQKISLLDEYLDILEKNENVQAIRKDSKDSLINSNFIPKEVNSSKDNKDSTLNPNVNSFNNELDSNNTAIENPETKPVNSSGEIIDTSLTPDSNSVNAELDSNNIDIENPETKPVNSSGEIIDTSLTPDSNSVNAELDSNNIDIKSPETKPINSSDEINSINYENAVNAKEIFKDLFNKANDGIHSDNSFKANKNVEYPYNLYSVDPNYRLFLDSLTQFIQLNDNVDIVIEGHTDNIGSESYNLTLSEKRATSVLNYLINKGIDKSRISIIGIGELRPIATNSTARGRALNRRTETFIIFTNRKK